MKALGKNLRESQADPITIVYKTSGSCTNSTMSGQRQQASLLHAPRSSPEWQASNF
jgi:hypothetical protein